MIQPVPEVAQLELNQRLPFLLLEAEDGETARVRPEISWPLDSKCLSSIYLTEHGLQPPGIQQCLDHLAEVFQLGAAADRP